MLPSDHTDTDASPALFNLASMDANLALLNSRQEQEQQQQDHPAHNNNSGGPSSSSSNSLRNLRNSIRIPSSAMAGGETSLMSQLTSSLHPELYDPDDAFDRPPHHVVGPCSAAPIGGAASSCAVSGPHIIIGGGGGRRSRTARTTSFAAPPPPRKGGFPAPLRKEAYRRAQSCPLPPQHGTTRRQPRYGYHHCMNSTSCLQVPPMDDLLPPSPHPGAHTSNNSYLSCSRGGGGGKRRSEESAGGDDDPHHRRPQTPLAAQIAASVRLDLATSDVAAERSAALRFILSNPAHFRQLQDDLRTSNVVTTRCAAVVLDRIVDERVRLMRAVREEALAKIREEREDDGREYARRMGLPFDHGDGDATAGNTTNDACNGIGGKATKGKVGWDHLLAGLTSVANLGAGFLKQSSTLGERADVTTNTGRATDDISSTMPWHIDEPSRGPLQDLRAGAFLAGEQPKKASPTTVAETLSRCSSGDDSRAEQQQHNRHHESNSLTLSYTHSSSSVSLSPSKRAGGSITSIVSSCSSSAAAGAMPTTGSAPNAVARAMSSAAAGTRRPGLRRRSLVARGA